jgi:flavin reductase (DIM6/NTAB) family NADH-FMN oxidoreductase RutF
MSMAEETEYRTINPAQDMDRASTYQLLNSLVVPRPIAWVSTCDDAGIANIAPHSYFTIASVVPPVLAFTSIGHKDTVRNISEIGEFVINVVDAAHADDMNTSSIDAPRGTSEFDVASIPQAASTFVRVPRVATAPAAFECTLDRIVEVGDEPAFMILGIVRRIHVAERIHDVRGRIDATALDAIARIGGSGYCTTRDQFTMQRPTWAEHTTTHRSTT